MNWSLVLSTVFSAIIMLLAFLAWNATGPLGIGIACWCCGMCCGLLYATSYIDGAKL